MPAETPKQDQNQLSSQKKPSRRSLRSLDRLNLSLGDVRDVFEPYLTIFLATDRHWNPAQIGLAISASSIAGILAQVPAGALIDAVNKRRSIIAIAMIAVSISYIVIIKATTLLTVISAQAVIGITAIIVGPAVAAVSLGLVGQERIEKRIGRNEAFNHTGNTAVAIIAGLVGQFAGRQWIFYIFAILCLATIAFVFRIRHREINYRQSRSQSSEEQKDHKPSRIQDLLHNRPLLIFATSVILFYFASAPLFPLVSQKIAGGQGSAPALFVSASIVVAQLTMILVATKIGNIANKWGRKPLFLVACIAVLIRVLLYTFSQNPWYLVAVQLLDGISSGIASILVVVVVADLAKGTGRFNLIQGAINASIGIGASLGNLVLGFLVHRTDFRIGFLTSAGIAVITLILFWFAMPETNTYKENS